MAVVNRTQLDAGAQGMIDHAVACQHAWSIIDTLFVVDDGQAARVGDIMERSLGRDGAICLGVKKGWNFVVTELRRQASLLFRLHLTICNVLMLVTYCPPLISWMINFEWHAGELACKVVHFVWSLEFCLISNTVASIAFDRAVCVAYLTSLSNPVRGLFYYHFLNLTHLFKEPCFI